MRRLSAYAILVLALGLSPGCGGEPASAPSESPAAPVPAPASTDITAPPRADVDPDSRGGAKNASVDERERGGAKSQQK
jgi:hypothetical protein